MAYIQFPDPESELAAQKLLRREQHSVLRGVSGKAVYALREIMLDELEQLKIPYTFIPDTKISEHLTAGAIENLEDLQARGELFPEMELPPTHHAVISIPVPSYLEKAARDLLEQYDPVEMSVSGESLVINVMDDSDPGENVVRLRCVVHRSKVDEIIDRLQDEEISGMSQKFMILVEADPDAPPAP